MYDVYMHANQKYISTMSTPKYHDTQIRQPNSNTGENEVFGSPISTFPSLHPRMTQFASSDLPFSLSF